MTDLALPVEKADSERSRLRQLFPDRACVEEKDLVDTTSDGLYIAFRIGPDTLRTIHRFDKSEATWKATTIGKWYARENT